MRIINSKHAWNEYKAQVLKDYDSISIEKEPKDFPIGILTHEITDLRFETTTKVLVHQVVTVKDAKRLVRTAKPMFPII